MNVNNIINKTLNCGSLSNRHKIHIKLSYNFSLNIVLY